MKVKHLLVVLLFLIVFLLIAIRLNIISLNITGSETKSSKWVTINYGKIVNNSILTHSGETVGDIIVKGTGVGKKAASGPAFIARTARDLEKIEEGQVLITVCTDLSSMAAIKKAAAIITEEGGLTSHAAIVAVNLSIPTVVGVKDALSLIKNGELITVDAIRGLIYRGEANVL